MMGIVAAIAASGVVGSAAGAGPSPQEVLAKAKRAMGSARTYQAVVLVAASRGPGAASTMRMDVKIQGGKRAITVTPVGRPSGIAAMMAAAGKLVFIDDGAQGWLWLPSRNQYVRVPHGVQNPALPNFDFRSLPTNEARYTYAMLPPARVAGRPVYVVRLTPKAPGPTQSTLDFYIDQGTYRFRQIRNTIANPRSPGEQIRTLVTIQNDIVNQPLAASTFAFVPPKGATEVRAGPPGQGPRPGMPVHPGGPGPPAAGGVR